jgi:hypothetical protein
MGTPWEQKFYFKKNPPFSPSPPKLKRQKKKLSSLEPSLIGCMEFLFSKGFVTLFNVD